MFYPFLSWSIPFGLLSLIQLEIFTPIILDWRVSLVEEIVVSDISISYVA